MDSNLMCLSPAAICEAVSADFKQRKITHAAAAAAIGKTKGVVSVQLSGKKAFSKEMALLFSEAFGYRVEFLLYGKGELKDAAPSRPSVSMVRLLDACETLLRASGNEEAVAAWDCLLSGDMEGYRKHGETIGAFRKRTAASLLLEQMGE